MPSISLDMRGKRRTPDRGSFDQTLIDLVGVCLGICLTIFWRKLLSRYLHIVNSAMNAHSTPKASCIVVSALAGL